MLGINVTNEFKLLLWLGSSLGSTEAVFINCKIHLNCEKVALIEYCFKGNFKALAGGMLIKYES